MRRSCRVATRRKEARFGEIGTGRSGRREGCRGSIVTQGRGYSSCGLCGDEQRKQQQQQQTINALGRHREPLDVLSHPPIKLSARYQASDNPPCASRCPSTTPHLRPTPARRNGCHSTLRLPSGLMFHQRTKMTVPAKSSSVSSTTHATLPQWTCFEHSSLERSCLLGR